MTGGGKYMDATYLFQRLRLGEPHRNHCKNTESWWTALFTFLMMDAPEKSLQTFGYINETDKFEAVSIWKPFVRPTYRNLIVESSLTDIADLKKDIGNTKLTKRKRPDVVLIDRNRIKIDLIEVKTVDAGAGSLRKYAEITKLLRDKEKGWDANLYLLVSVGHDGGTGGRLWEEVSTLQKGKHAGYFSLLLWEDVFANFDGHPLLTSLGLPKTEPLSRYYRDALKNKLIGKRP